MENADPVLMYLYEQTLVAALRLACAEALVEAGYVDDVPLSELEATAKGEWERAWAYANAPAA